MSNVKEISVEKLLGIQQDAIELLQNYISELHQTNITTLESLHSVVRPLAEENKELRERIEKLEQRQ